ncbi:hypothetical protein PRIPAC_77264, partial [Pristionchus pacificus]|uniref:Uncharacterized protein n=1 Tax=Pristionchus pacificus TaxID=54126 RepID=A0A2A6C3Q0_PRIPA
IHKRSYISTMTMITIAVSCGAACALGFISVFLHLYYSSQKVSLFLVGNKLSPQDENLSSLYGQSFNVVHTIAVPINVGLVVYSMPAWKNNVQLNLHRWFPFIPSPSTMEVVRDIGVSDTYFKDLLGSWEIKNTADKNRK